MKYALAIIFLAFSHNLHSQSIMVKNADDSAAAVARKYAYYNLRTLYAELNTGVLEGLGMGIGVQISPDYSALLKFSGTFINRSDFILPNTGVGFGVQFNYYSRFWIFNAVSLEYVKYNDLSIYPSITDRGKGYFVDLSFTSEKILKKFYNAFWSLGVSLSAARGTIPLVFPSFKYGMNLNIF